MKPNKTNSNMWQKKWDIKSTMFSFDFKILFESQMASVRNLILEQFFADTHMYVNIQLKRLVLTSGGSQTHSPVVRLAYMCSLVRGSMISTHSILLIRSKEGDGDPEKPRNTHK